MDEYADRLLKVSERYGIDSSEAGILSGAMKLLDSQPSAEREEYRTGKWKQCGKEIECDRCGAIYPDYIHPICGRHNYCPNCGAKMEVKND